MAVNIGLLGCGHLGKIHLRILKTHPAYNLVGIYDADPATRAAVSAEYGVRAFDSIDELLALVDAVDIVTPTITHYEVASKAVKQLKHVFIEKPITADLDTAKKLVSLVREAGVRAMVGHVERFNPAYLALEGHHLRPAFIEIHRNAIWTPRAKDVSVVVDVMIHDIDIVLHTVGSPVKRIHASGTPVVADSADIVNARIEFHNGAVANITASRISMANMRKMRIFQPNEYITVDFLEKKTSIFHLVGDEGLNGATPDHTFEMQATGGVSRRKHLRAEHLEVKPVNSIELELTHFAESIRTGNEPPVTVDQAYDALHVAFQIEEKINSGAEGE